jgi:serine/threonine protein phosphatase PrpC
VTSLFKKLFGKKLPSPESITPENIETAPLKIDIDELASLSADNKSKKDAGKKPQLDLPQLIVGVSQSVGKQRDHNEDALFTLTTNLASGENHIQFGFYIIADGMGGHEHGEVASGVSVRAMASYVVHKLYLPLFGISGDQADESIQEIMQEGVFQAHRVILKEASGGGTTLTAALILGDQMTITHVGDSRAYIIYPDGRMQTLTHDHTLVKRLEELGQISAEEAAIHPQRNVLYRALGQGEPFEPDIATFPVPRGSHLLMCSDGLWGVVSERELFNTVSTSPNPQLACQSLIDAANSAGGPDNISVVIVRLPE